MNVAIIPAKGGSVRLPRKNIRNFAGSPIIAYSIRAAVESDLFSSVIASTDDDEIAAIAYRAGASVAMRPKSLDQVGTQEVAHHALTTHLDRVKIDLACVIYATVPMLTVADLRAGYRALPGHEFAMSVGTEPLRDAGMFYFGRAAAFRERLPLIAPHTAMVPMPEERICDINTAEDWCRAERMYLANLPKEKCATS